MTILRGTGRYSIIAIILILTWSFIYLVNGTVVPVAHTFYFSIILAARFWGTKGGILIGFVAGLLAGPFMPVDVENHISETPFYWFIRMFYFIFCGAFLGKWFTVLEEKKKDLELKNKEVIEQRDDIIHKNEQIKQFSTGMIRALSQSIEVRDSYTRGHCDRVSAMSVRIGESMGLEKQELLFLKWSAMLHDIGKIGIPEKILNKVGKLTIEEYDVIKQHPALGEKILRGTPHADSILGGVMHHHERMDGNGYPYGLLGNKIGIQAKIIAVCDVWDALTSKRSYRDAMSRYEALKIMESGRGTQFDPFVLDLFLEDIAQDRINSR